ncbi:hypothetical protein V6N11_058831 [Hibiscus sabdariffa]|uniref:COMM domain-containing protein n=1 Tax=Hibiscus sabdariffa TaxID=183260 RepID=A0ABR2U5F2_9ROSI
MERTLWGHLPLLVRANSKESVEFILQTLWRTRKSGLDADDRRLICEMLQLQNDADLDPLVKLLVSLGYSTHIKVFLSTGVIRQERLIPLLVCLRMLIRKCVYENISKNDIQKLFPEEVLPELQRLLTLLLQKFQREWRDDIHMDKAMTWNMATQDAEMTEPTAVINLKLQNDTRAPQGELDLKFPLAKETLDTMLKSMYSPRDQLSNLGET